MHKTFWKILITLTFLLTACGQSTPALQATPQPDQPTTTSSPLPTATPTRTALPSATPTASITPLPTIPTFTPTFDISTIVTVTPAPKAECPKEDPVLIPDFPYCENGGCSGGPYHDATQNYLNVGGTLEKLEKKQWGITADLTGDGLKELIFTEWGSAFIYGCKEGRYELLLEIKGTQNTPSIDYIIDLNRNGISELISSNHERRYFSSISIVEWNGKEFIPLIERKQVIYAGDVISIDWVGGTVFKYEMKDINSDGLKEIVAVDNDLLVPDYLSGLPLRKVTTILSWNGRNFVILSDDPSLPEYRFQSIQDADKLIHHRQYEKALNFYQDAIFSDKLEWWSKDRKVYESYKAVNDYFANWLSESLMTATPYPTMPVVAPDTTEYPRLAAYAYYRIMLIHLVQGNESDATTVYNTLQEKFGNDQYGQPYVEMATAFWEAYQSTHKMYDGCAATIQYAVEHPAILTPLGSDYHGTQSHIYKPEDVCPFR